MSVNIFITYFDQSVACGFASPANDYPHESINLNDLLNIDPNETFMITEDNVCKPVDMNDALNSNPHATFLIRANGDSMKDAGILNGNYVVVDRSKGYYPGCIAVCVFNNGFTIKRVYMENGITKLVSANKDFDDVILSEGDNLIIWGLVTWALNKMIK
ncbi:LexA family protein [Flavobacterium sp.]|uniref:LexA family protein n=1 Tax=Flavobacterium sp. TaxID=239 RepID=UPI004033DC49